MKITQDIQAYYQDLEETRGYVALCSMHLPRAMRGKRVLDVGCRNGKGALKLADRVGEQGKVVGLDWDEEHIELASLYTHKSVLSASPDTSNLSFCLGYPEDLGAAGISPASFDVVYCNSVFNLLYNPQACLKQFARALVPKGMLFLDVAISTNKEEPEIIWGARRLGNAIQAAFCDKQLESMLKRAGFDHVKIDYLDPLVPEMGAKVGETSLVIKSNKMITYLQATVEAYKEG